LRGEEIIAETYEAVRNGPGWNKTLFVIVYDEHGGFWDPIPPPDPVVSTGPAVDVQPPFNFNRLGARVPK
jgi:phospholipase C